MADRKLVDDIMEISQRVERQRKRVEKLEWEGEQLRKRLKEEFGADDLEGGAKKLAVLGKRIAKLESDLSVLVGEVGGELDKYEN